MTSSSFLKMEKIETARKLNGKVKSLFFWKYAQCTRNIPSLENSHGTLVPALGMPSYISHGDSLLSLLLYCSRWILIRKTVNILQIYSKLIISSFLEFTKHSYRFYNHQSQFKLNSHLSTGNFLEISWKERVCISWNKKVGLFLNSSLFGGLNTHRMTG